MSSKPSALATRILWSMIVGVALGCAMVWLGGRQPQALEHARRFSAAVLDPLGRIFLHLLFFVVVPLVFSSLALGVVQLGRLGRLGPLAGRTFLLFALNMAIGVTIGLVFMDVFRPGDALSAETKARLLGEFAGAARQAAESRPTQAVISFASLVDMFLPRNLLKAVVDFQVLPLILFALLVGAAGTQLAEESRRRLQASLEILSELMTRVVHFALLLAPVAVPAMLFSVIVKNGAGIVKSLAVFVALCLVAMALHLFGTLSLWIKLLARRSPLEFFRSSRVAMIMAFSTSSSNATLPASLQVCRENLGVSPSVAGFVIPLGATMNMSGTALYEGCVVLFVAQVFGVDLSMAQQLTLLLLSVLSAVAVAGIPGGSLPLIAGLLITFGIPPEGIGIVIGADRILDMTRTMTNVGCDMVTTVIVDQQVQRANARSAVRSTA
jgi:DAACS family dicarboxylate/amino acid:cation (Na+ or H+) symporter